MGSGDESTEKLEDLLAGLSIESIETIYAEGIKERLEDIVEDDIYHRYGVLIAQGKIDFSRDVLENTTELTKVVSKLWKRSETFDW